MFMRFISYYILTLFFCLTLCSQKDNFIYLEKNLIPNNSFENYKRASGNINQAIPWRGIGTVDYYQLPDYKDTSSSRGGAEGMCYAGLRFQKKYKEYLQVKLTEPLRRNVRYKLQMKVRLAPWSNRTLKSFGVYVSKVGFTSMRDVIRTNVFDSVSKNGVYDNNLWFTIEKTIIPEGGEKFLTIGNFSNKVKKDMNNIKISGLLGLGEAYYFIDDVNLKPQKTEEDIKTVLVDSYYESINKDSLFTVDKEVKVGSTIKLDNVYFDKNRAGLLGDSYLELNKLVNYLKVNPKVSILIKGHSDKSGILWQNQKISEQRARNVFEYLISKGVQNRMSFKGYGASMPLFENDTEIHKAKNRRVDFEILKQ